MHRKAETARCRAEIKKRRNAGTDTTEWEREIDQRVYALYGLTPDEVKIVEDSTR
jgi:hypothetical protein